MSLLLAIIPGGVGLAGDFDVVITEVHYHPPEVTPGDEANEFIEIQNLAATEVALSGWTIEGGIAFAFPGSAVLPPGGFAVVALDAAHLESDYGITGVYGNFTGRLANDGERVALRNAGGDLIDRIDYRDDPPWPENPDGLGPSLEKTSSARNGEEQGSWRSSVYLGGTPGRANSTEVRRTATALVPRGSSWKYKKGTSEPASPLGAWAGFGFNDTSWSSGASGFGYDDDDDATVLPDMEGSYSTVYVRKRFTLTSLTAYETISLSIIYDDAYVAYLNGVEIGRSAFAGGTRGTPLPFNALAEDTHENDDGIDSIVLTSIPGVLQAGDNVLAIQLLNESLTSSDASLIPVLTGIQAESSGIAEPPHDVEINEVFGGSTPGGGFIELHNEGPSLADISGWRLVNSPLGEGGYIFPPNTKIPSGSFLAVPEASLPFDVTDAAEWFGIVTPDLRFVDGVSTRARPAGQPWGRYPDGDGDTFVLDAPTSGAPNTVSLETSIVINEIQFHPPLGATTAEYVEIHNRGTQDVDITGWRLDKAVEYTFPTASIPMGGYVVVAGNTAAVSARYGLAEVFGPWTGRLANDAEKIELLDALENRVDVVHYADDGRWPPSTTSSGPDGFGPSIELVHPDTENNHGSAWLASTGIGTPGAQNSRLTDDPPPVIRAVSHSPAMPRPSDAVTITARAFDERAVASVRLFSRPDGTGPFSQATMLDDGAHGDGEAGDGRHGAVLPARPNGSIVQFYIEALDDVGHTRRFPSDAPARVCLYQVDDRPYPPGLPLYRAVLRQVDLTELVTRDLDSDVLLDGTFIHGDEATYNVGIRYRGEHSREFPVKSFRVQFHHDEAFEDITDLDLNAEGNAYAHLAADFFRRADMPVYQAEPVVFTLDNDWEVRHGGIYLRVEDVGGPYLAREFKNNDTGNLYRGFDAGGGNQGDLSYEGTTASNYATVYDKKTNQELNDYSDLITLTNAFTNSTNSAFPSAISALIDVEQWIRYFAVETVLDNRDGCIATNVGEDYFIYHRPSDLKWVILPWDQNETFQQPDDGIFRMSVDAVQRLVTHAAFEPLYYDHLIQLLDGPFQTTVMNRQIDSVRFAFPALALDQVKDFVPVRQTTVRGLVPIQQSPFVRGDANTDGVVDLSDALKVLLYLFGGVPVSCADALDANDNGAINVTDAVYILGYLFQSRPAPPLPFPTPGSDPTQGDPHDCSNG